MQLRFIDPDTALTIQCLTNDEKLINEYQAKFVNLIGITSFYAESEELYNSFEELNLLGDDIRFKISFFRDHNLYSFKAKASKIVKESGRFLTLIHQISDISQSTRRTYPRLEIFIPVSLFTNLKTLLIEGQSLDISAEGLCLLSNEVLKIDDDIPYYLLEFNLNISENFLMPSKFVRRGDSPQLKQFRFDYGFLFDYTTNPTDKSRLVTSLFMHKINGLR